MTIERILYGIRTLADAIIEQCEQCQAKPCATCALRKTKPVIDDVNRDIVRGKREWSI